MVRGQTYGASRWAATPGPAWAIAVFSLALCMIALVLHGRTTGGLGAATDLHLADLWLAALGPVVGAVLCGRTPGSRVGPVLLSTAAASVGSAGGAYAVWAAERGGAPGAAVAAWAATWTWVSFFVPPLLVALLLSPGHGVFTRWFLRVAAADLVLIAALSAVAPGPVGSFRSVANPWGIVAAPWLGTAAGVLVGLTAVVLVPVVLLLCLVRWRRATGDERPQAALVATGQCVFTACLLAPIGVQPWSDVLTAVGQTTLLAVAALVTQLRVVTSALRAERESLARAREEERRRLHRDLHDGVAPELSGLALQLDALAAESEDVPAQDRLSAVGDRLRTTVGEIRRVVDDLRPAGLEALGLADALRAHARAFCTTDLSCTVESVPAPDLPDTIEVAAYRIVAEATTNAARHSGASHCRISVQVNDGALLLEVEDNGRWGPPDPDRTGVGIASMRARAGDVGGTLDIRTGPEGTVVSAVLPVRP